MEERLELLARDFRRRYSSEPRFFRAPGRVNLIGEHTDYNEGFVFPFAIDRSTVVAAALRDDSKLNAAAIDLDESVTIDLDARPRKRRGNWIDYIEGTARCIAAREGGIRGADISLTSTVPIGAGLSSSAALEVAVGFALLSIDDRQIDGKELAFAAQRAEHEYVGTRSGIMDQFAAVFGKVGHAMLLDCRSLEIETIPLALGETEIVVIDTKVKHELAASEYNVRREQCEEGVRLLGGSLDGVRSLRDVSRDQLERHRDKLPPVVFRRCRHVIAENQRTLAAAEAFREGNFAIAGRLLNESHRSLRDDYEVSSAELDFLADQASAMEGVFGARMMGGGFGGCTVNLVEKRAEAELRSVITSKYRERFEATPEFYVFTAADGASEVTC